MHCAVDEDDDATATDAKLFAEMLAAERRDHVKRHLVYTTGCSVYGSHGAQTVLTESTPCAAESWRYKLEQQLATVGIPYTVLRPAFVYGGGSHRSLLSQWFAQGEADDTRFFGSVSKVWSWIRVEDLATAYAEILKDAHTQDGQIYVVADAPPVSAPWKPSLRACG